MATRTGSKASGIQGHIRGWDTGVKVQIHTGTDDEDVVTVWRTGGLNSSGHDTLVAQFTSSDKQFMGRE